jgi:hypothetical protein
MEYSNSSAARYRSGEVERAVNFAFNSLGEVRKSLRLNGQVLSGREANPSGVVTCLRQSVRAGVQMAKLGVELPTLFGQLGVGFLDEGFGDDLRYKFPEDGFVRAVGHVVAQAPFVLSPRAMKGDGQVAFQYFLNEVDFYLSHGSLPKWSKFLSFGSSGFQDYPAGAETWDD